MHKSLDSIKTKTKEKGAHRRQNPLKPNNNNNRAHSKLQPLATKRRLKQRREPD